MNQIDILRKKIKSINNQYIYLLNQYNSYNNIKILKMSKNEKCLISQEDYNLLSSYKWHKNIQGYASARINGKLLLMHRFLLNPKTNLTVDHINGNKLDNRRINLRILEKQQNNENKTKKMKGATSTFFGVFFEKRSQKYISNIIVNGKKIYLGKYINEKEAAIIRDRYIIQNNLNHMQLNFPENINEYKENKYNFNKKEKKVSYNGVHYNNKRKKFISEIIFKRKYYNLMSSDNAIDCAKAYDNFIIKNNIKGKKLNFPNEYPEYDPKKIKTFYKEIDGKTIQLISSTIKSKIITIDKEDYEKVKYFSISVGSGNYVRCIQKGKIFKLHRIIMNINDSKIFIDHIDGNKYNNTKSNLRVSNAQKNSQNKLKSKKRTFTSKYLGVSYSKKDRKWKCGIRCDGKLIEKSNIIDEETCARLRDLIIINKFPDSHFKMNFEWTKEEINMWQEKLLNKLI